MWVVRVNRFVYDTQALLQIFKKSVQLGARKIYDPNQPGQWLFQFNDEKKWSEYWTFVNEIRPMELP